MDTPIRDSIQSVSKMGGGPALGSERVKPDSPSSSRMIDSVVRDRGAGVVRQAWLPTQIDIWSLSRHGMSPHDSWLAMIALLQPTADVGLVAQILVGEGALEKPLFSRDHNRRDEANSQHESYEQPKVIHPNRQSERKQDERPINGIASEPVGTCAHDRSARFASPHRGASRPKFPVRKQKEQYGAKSNKRPEPPKSRWPERKWPGTVQCDPQQNCRQKHNRRSEQARQWAAFRSLVVIGVVLGIHDEVLSLVFERHTFYSASSSRLEVKK